MDAQFFITNRKELAKRVKNGLVILHSGCVKRVSTHETYSFRPNKMFYYFTGILEPQVLAILKIENEIVEPYLFIPNRDPESEKWDGKQLTLEESSRLSGMALEDVFYMKDLHEKWTSIRKTFKHLPIWANVADGQDTEFNNNYGVSIKGETVRCFHQIATDLRRIKTKAEIKAIQTASEIAGKGIANVIKHAKPSLYEYELEAKHDYVMKSHGLKSTQYKTILGSGKNTTILHYLDNNRRIDDNDLILIDIDVEVNAYHCDMTRTFPANGKFSPRQKEVYLAVLEVQKQLVSMVKPGITYGELNKASKQLLTTACEELGLFKEHKDLKEYYFHNVGHAIGLDTHDVCEFHEDDVFEEGMVLTVEPGLYIFEENIGVRIEDIVAVTEDGHINLTEHLVKEVADIEQLMNN